MLGGNTLFELRTALLAAGGGGGGGARRPFADVRDLGGLLRQADSRCRWWMPKPSSSPTPIRWR
jgi:hypothetical protein